MSQLGGLSSASRFAYRLMVRSRVPRLVRGLSRGAVVFCFHNVVPRRDTGRGDASLHMATEHFQAVIDWIASTYEVVSLSELVMRVRQERSVRGLTALTFDDAYGGCIHYGLVVLEARQLPATVFVVPSAAQCPRAFWWDRLAARGELSVERRRELLDRQRGAGAEILSVRATSEAVAEPELPADYMPESWDGLREALQKHPLLKLGSHTATHPNLTALTSHELADELSRSRGELEEAVGREVDTVSYPYGLHDGRVLEAARHAGYGAGVTLGPGLVRTGQDTMGIPRLNVPASIGLEALECWALGLGLPGRS